MMSLYDAARGASLPWNSKDAPRKRASPSFDSLPEQNIEICLNCQLCASSCDRCDGYGNLTGKRGRPSTIDTDQLREMLTLKRCNREICTALGISARTLQRAKKQIKEDGGCAEVR